MKRAKVSEADIAAIVVAYLEDSGHDVYQEVGVSSGNADIVAIVGPRREVWIVETKTTWSLDLLEQCIDRKRDAARVFAAVPLGPRRRSRDLIFAEFGIGVMSVDPGGDGKWQPRVSVDRMATRVSRDPRHGAKTRRACKPGHKTHAVAGTNGGGRYTPFVATCEALRDVVVEHPGIALKDAIEKAGHHYRSAASARSSLAHWIGRGKVPGVDAVVEGGALRLYARTS